MESYDQLNDKGSGHRKVSQDLECEVVAMQVCYEEALRSDADLREVTISG